jgi:hypothetical protein
MPESQYHLVSSKDLRAQKRRAFWGAVAAVVATVIQALLLVDAVPTEYRLMKICQAIVMVLGAYGYRSALLTPIASSDKLPDRSQSK